MIENPKPFYFLRHGKTQPNAEGIMCGGKWDVPLCPEGTDQAFAIARQVVHLDPKPVRVFASPLVRARQTAEIVTQTLGLDISFLDDLKEWDLGQWDGQKFEQVKDLFLQNGEPPEGETRAELQARVVRALTHCLKEPGTPLIVAHGGVGLMIQLLFGITRLRMQNCNLFYFHPGEGAWTMTLRCE